MSDEATSANIKKTSNAVDIGSSSDFREGGGRQVNVGGRQLSVFRHRGILYALDHHCYHAGGPLTSGDIEDLVVKGASHPCVVCPWHKYKISLKTGEGIYLHADPFSKAGSKSQLKSRGKKQRTHEIYEDGDGRVNVILDLSEDTQYGSDYYASQEFQLLMKRNNG